MKDLLISIFIIIGLLYIGLKLYFSKKRNRRCFNCNVKLTSKNNTQQRFFHTDVCDKKECHLEAWEHERARDSFW